MSRLRGFFSLPNGLFLAIHRLITFLWSWNGDAHRYSFSFVCFFFCICASFDVVRGVTSHAEACQGGVKSDKEFFASTFVRWHHLPVHDLASRMTFKHPETLGPDSIISYHKYVSTITANNKNRRFGSRTKNSSNHHSPAFDDAVKLSTFVCLTDVLHGCVINYVIKSQRDGSENYEILLNTSRDVSLYVRLVSANQQLVVEKAAKDDSSKATIRLSNCKVLVSVIARLNLHRGSNQSSFLMIRKAIIIGSLELPVAEVVFLDGREMEADMTYRL